MILIFYYFRYVENTYTVEYVALKDGQKKYNRCNLILSE